MAKIVIGALGTTRYTPAEYAVGEDPEVRTPYCISAIAQHVQPDKVILLLTLEAAKMHYDSIASELQPKIEVQQVPITAGANPAELWRNFDAIAAEVHSGDEVYFDITNGFRSLPFIFMSAIEYLHRARNVSVAGIYYGAFEAGGRSPNLVTPQSQTLNEIASVPVFRLDLFLVLADWAHAVATFKTSGDGAKLAGLLQDFQIDDIQMKEALAKVADHLRHYSLALNLIRPIEVMDAAHALMSAIDSFNILCDSLADEAHFPAPFRELLATVRSSCSSFALPQETAIGDIRANMRHQLKLMHWIRALNRYYDLAVLASEWIVSWGMLFAENPRQNIYANPFDYQTRQSFKRCFSANKRNCSLKLSSGAGTVEPLFVDKLWHDTGQIRNDLAHCGWDVSNRNEKSNIIIDKIENIMECVNTLGAAL